MPVAASCWMTPAGRFELAGVTEMDDTVKSFTVTVVLDTVVPNRAVMVAVPRERAVTKSPLTAATAASEVLQTTCELISCTDESEYLPVAVNFWITPKGMLESVGEIEIKERVAVLMVRVVLGWGLEPEIELSPEEVAVIVVVPAEMPVATPLLSMVATDVLEDVQVTCFVTSLWVPLL